jgi:hypothetical protein
LKIVLDYTVAEVQSEFYYCCTKNSLICLGQDQLISHGIRSATCYRIQNNTSCNTTITQLYSSSFIQSRVTSFLTDIWLLNLMKNNKMLGLRILESIVFLDKFLCITGRCLVSSLLFSLSALLFSLNYVNYLIIMCIILLLITL